MAKDQRSNLSSEELTQAIQKNNIVKVQGLLAINKEIVNAFDNKNKLPIVQAVFWNKFDILNILLEHGANVNKKDGRGESALTVAANKDTTEYLETLLKVDGIELDITNKFGSTPLVVAAMKKRLEAVSKLIENGAGLDLQNNEGETALMKAANLGCKDIVTKFIGAGADVSIKNNKGKTASDIAKDKNEQEIIGLLASALDALGRDIKGDDDAGESSGSYSNKVSDKKDEGESSGSSSDTALIPVSQDYTSVQDTVPPVGDSGEVSQDS